MALPQVSCCYKSIQEDRFSKLPDGILQYILSFLLTRQAVKLSSVSRRWRHLWKSSDSLYFNGPDFLPGPGALKSFADNVLDLSLPKSLLNLRVSNCGHHDASIHDASILELQRNGITMTGGLYEYDPINGKVTHPFSVCFWPFRNGVCLYRPVRGFCIDSLRSLNLSYIRLRFPLESLLVKCPLLEDLVLKWCQSWTFKICSDKLQRLLIYRCDYENSEIVVSAPSLLSLSLESTWNQTSGSVVTLENLFSLTHAFFDCSHKYGFKILNVLQNVKVLTLDNFHLDVLYEDLSPESLTTFHNLKSLTIKSCQPSTKSHTHAIRSLLHRTPVLETLVLTLSSYVLSSCKRIKRKRGAMLSKNTSISCFSHLRVVEFRNFGSSASEVELFQFLSSNMKVAKSRIIVVPVEEN